MWSEELNEAFWYFWGWMLLCFPYLKVCLIDVLCPSPIDMLCPFTSKLETPYNMYKETYTMELILQL